MIRAPRRPRLSRTSLALASALALTLPATGHASGRFEPPDCGVSSLYVLQELTGRHVDLRDLYRALPPRHKDGYSHLELQDAARRCGLRLWGGRLSRENLPLRRPAIAYFNVPRTRLGHYVVLTPVGTTGTMVQVIDPPYYPRIVDYTDVIPAGSSITILSPIEFWETRGFLAVVSGMLATLAAILLFLGRRAAGPRQNGPAARRFFPPFATEEEPACAPAARRPDPAR